MANDAAEQITSQVRKLAEELGIPAIQVDSMKRLGEACGIDVGTAIANDAAEQITSQVRKLAEELGIPAIQVDSMKRL
ncbi:hypothetical protein B9D06_22125, partial [Mycobacterium tuberculosis]